MSTVASFITLSKKRRGSSCGVGVVRGVLACRAGGAALAIARCQSAAGMGWMRDSTKP